MQIGERIKQARKSKGITLRSLAQMTGYTDHSTIARIEKGEAQPSFEKLEAICQALDIPIFELMDMSHAQPATEEELLLRRFRRLDAYNKKLVLDLARQLGPENPL